MVVMPASIVFASAITLFHSLKEILANPPTAEYLAYLKSKLNNHAAVVAPASPR